MKRSTLPPAEGSIATDHDGTTERWHRNHNNGAEGKLLRMLSVFAYGKQLNTFDAQVLGDTCLNTTVSCLQARYGIAFSRDWQKVPNRFGTHARVRVYWLTGDSLEKARAIIDRGRA